MLELPKATYEISDWLVEQALGSADLATVTQGLCTRFVEAGIPLARGHFSVRTLHPVIGAIGMTWTPDHGVEAGEYPHESQASEAWQRSTFKALLDSGKGESRLDPQDPAVGERFPMMAAMAASGATDYFAAITAYAPTERMPSFAGRPKDEGIMSSWTTREPGGFTDTQIAMLRRLLPRFAVVVRVAIRHQIARNALVTYLGAQAGLQVLAGQIRRGDGQTIPAVIWYCDLRDSTPLAERYPGEAFLAVLNDYFEATAGAVLAHGGQVLRFIGDAVLAIFRHDVAGSEGAGPSQRTACLTALAAAGAARQRLGEINATRTAAGEVPLEFGLGLHVGEVIYGNIGVPERLEFTVVGAAANEGARIEDMTRVLGEPIIVSDAFARAAGVPMRSLGTHRLRGVGSERELFAPGLTELSG